MPKEGHGPKIYKIPSKRDVAAARKRTELRERANTRLVKRARWMIAAGLVGCLVLIIAGGVGIKRYRQGLIDVPTSFMEPTLSEGETVRIGEAARKTPSPGDIVAFLHPGGSKGREPHSIGVLRVVAIGGQKVEIRRKALYVDEKAVSEPHKVTRDDRIFGSAYHMSRNRYQKVWEDGRFSDPSEASVRDNFGPVVVPSEHVFLLGDNRDRSYDSRWFGPISVESLMGPVRS